MYTVHSSKSMLKLRTIMVYVHKHIFCTTVEWTTKGVFTYRYNCMSLNTGFGLTTISWDPYHVLESRGMHVSYFFFRWQHPERSCRSVTGAAVEVELGPYLQLTNERNENEGTLLVRAYTKEQTDYIAVWHVINLEGSKATKAAHKRKEDLVKELRFVIGPLKLL